MGNDSVRHFCSLVLRLVSQGGDFVDAGVYTDLSELNQNPACLSKKTLYIEGRRVSQALGDTWITVALDPDGPGPAGYVHDDTVRVTVVDLRITAPQEPVFGELNLTFIDGLGCLRQSNQAVSDEALGILERKRLYQIAGTLAPEGLSPKWELAGDGGADVGTLENDTTLNPTHDPPASAPESPPATGTLKLKARYNGQDIGLKDEVPIEVFKDHLARDVVNYIDEKGCSPIQLADDTLFEGENMPCQSSASHAAYGGRSEIDTVKAEYTLVERLTWADFETFTLKRGDIIWIRKLNLWTDPPYERGGLHWSTAICDECDGLTGTTWAGDSLSSEFRVECVNEYLLMFFQHQLSQHDPNDPGYQQGIKEDVFLQGHSNFQGWRANIVSIDVFGKPGN